MIDFDSQRKEMVDFQIKGRGISNPRILKAFYDVPREKFVLSNMLKYAYGDQALPLDYEQTISQPYVVALMTDMIDPQLDDVILEIGTGSGYQAAILSTLCKKVISYERIQGLVKMAQENLESANIYNVEVIHGDGTYCTGHDIYDKCILTAAARGIPRSIIEACKDQALILLPEGNYNTQRLNLYQKSVNDTILIQDGIAVCFVPLRGDQGW